MNEKIVEERFMNKKIIIGMGAVIVALAAILIIVLLGGQKPAHEHSWSEWQISKQATCTLDGLQTRVCDGCDESQSITIYATGHKYGNWTTTKEATCTVNGSKERTCNCGEIEKAIINATGHQYSGWTTTKEATCTVDGTREKSCNCGDKKTETIVASHSWKSATCVDPRKCVKCNLTEGSALGHTCKIGGTCTRCNKKVEPVVHMPSAPIIVNWRNKGSFKITDISYEFGQYYLTITYSGEKISGADGAMVGFKFQIVDPEGYIIVTLAPNISNLNTGDKYRDATIDIRLDTIEGLSEFTIIIEDYQ